MQQTMGRRDMFGAMFAAAEAAGVGPAVASRAVRRIDVHAHFVPPVYRAALETAGITRPDGMPAIPAWDADLALATMAQHGISTMMLSISSPGVDFGPPGSAPGLARAVNEAGAALVARHPTKFGLFASLPLPDVAASLAEISYVFDTLQVDGVVLLTHYRGIYLGDKKFEPVMAELARRSAKIFIHPTSAACNCAQGAALPYPAPMMEFFFETTRAVTNLILGGALARHPALRVIVPHGGATLPILCDRIAGFAPMMPPSVAPGGATVMAALRELYYDLAGSPLPHQLPALLDIADPSHLFYGSDWPFTPAPIVGRLAAALDGTKLLDAGLREDIYARNATRLFPRLG